MGNVPLNIDFQQILLHLLNVAILFAVLFFLVYKPVKNFMDKRKQEYLDEEEAARAKMKEAEVLKTEYETKIKNVDEEIQKMKADAENIISERISETQQAARAQADEILIKAKAMAENEKEKILDETSEQVTEIAREAVSKVLFESSSEAFDSFLDTVGSNKEKR